MLDRSARRGQRLIYASVMEMGEPAAVELSRGRRWLLAVSAGLLAYFVVWMLYVFGSLVCFTLFKVQLPSWDIWPVRVGLAVLAVAAATLVVRGRMEQRSQRRYGGTPNVTRWAVVAGVVLALAVVAPVAVAEGGEARFVSMLPPNWDKHMALDLGHRECAWLKHQPWGEPGRRGVSALHAWEMRGRELTHRGTMETMRVLQRADHYLCPFQGFVHNHDFDLSRGGGGGD